MRGTDQQQGHVFSYISPEQRVRKDHPLRPVRAMVDQVLKELSPEFNKMYSKVGRPSIPPEQLLRALLLQVLYSEADSVGPGSLPSRLPEERPKCLYLDALEALVSLPQHSGR
jgi:hypothetical protein